MKPSLTDQLCTRCGLCCDGSLFADVELAGSAEAAGLEVMGLEIEEDDTDGAVLVQQIYNNRHISDSFIPASFLCTNSSRASDK